MTHKHDVAIIGGGVVGCSVLFELTNRGFDCVLLEKNESLVAEASCGNRILPRKGQYLVYEKRANSLLNSSILPIPSQVGKGVIIFRSVYDNVLVGPTSEEVKSRLLPAIDNDVTHRLMKHCDDTIPNLKNYKVVTQYSGVRPATQTKDYIIKADRKKSWITVGGIRSTGVSGCLGIAEKVHDLLTEDIGLDPSRSLTTINSLDYRRIAHDYVAIDGAAYKITHPITLSGMEYSAKL